MTYPQLVLEFAREHARARIAEFSAEEERVLRHFFTNTTGRVFLMFGLPSNVGAALLALYSRMKSARGLRGIFVDTFVPQLLATDFPEVEIKRGEDGTETPLVEKYLRERGVTSLEQFVAHRPEAATLLEEFIASMADPHWWKKLAEAKRAKRLLSVYLDTYGHNSIARGAGIWVCFEKISILAAKSIEWTRPGSGYIELSTRYVDMAGGDTYPIGQLVGHLLGAPGNWASDFDEEFSLIRKLQGENFDGVIPQFLRERYADRFSPEDIKAGIMGETCDLVGNLLPCATFTSLGAFVSGEAFPQLLKHLILDDTPENLALAELVVEEASKIGADQFARHWEPTEWETANWEYLCRPPTSISYERPISKSFGIDPSEFRFVAESVLDGHFETKSGLASKMLELAQRLANIPRGKHDKLPSEFEAVTMSFGGTMSFRGWRDVHRQGFCTHNRTLVTPELGFYECDKPAPHELVEAFAAIHAKNTRVWEMLLVAGVPSVLRQYFMAMGNLVGFTLAGNLRQLEFCNWQRSDWNVNHEVRQVFLSIEKELRNIFPWWEKISRADMTPAYIFARGKTPVPLSPFSRE